eukprot:CAMPEP_0184649154 /NCGR_PEP_ID=MMETSP0308-20130426/6405_1 /TAXON_ID=38269 /ORGANISM="Gloeochaete witrockiana, Strain SAG 46.84" /LENGTH=278 /DNA_ID=CAMNT_0027081613 /DNA_START=251 /DNA_END=1088 /DNA_ORIENTATION=+
MRRRTSDLRLGKALSPYKVDLSVLKSLCPIDVILTQVQTSYSRGALSTDDIRSALCEVLSTPDIPKIVSLDPQSLDDVWSDILQVGSAIGVAASAQRLVDDLKGRFRAVSDDALRANDQRGGQAPSCVCIQWGDPLMVAGSYVLELIPIAGGRNALSPSSCPEGCFCSWDQLLASDPDVVVIMLCGSGLDASVAEWTRVTDRNSKVWRQLRAVRNSQVYYVDADHLFSRPGPLLLESTQVLAEILHPSLRDRWRHLSRLWRAGESGVKAFREDVFVRT